MCKLRCHNYLLNFGHLSRKFKEFGVLRRGVYVCLCCREICVCRFMNIQMCKLV